jgi:hypothetical protein
MEPHLFMGEKKNPYLLLLTKPEGRPGYMWMDNNNMDFGEVGLGSVDWIGLAQDTYKWRALVNSVMNLLVP